IGEKRAQALFKFFKTQIAMKNASVDELAAAPGMTKNTAQALYDYFHGGGAIETDAPDLMDGETGGDASQIS
ncbi:MAG: hypothetical protein LBV27_08380, partial [Oscillospiraceae bacterium]|nr:hypothetical protein [Oscillospiraceae bacterium]